MKMRTDISKGIAAVGMLLLMGMNAQAQCPNTSVAFPQSGTACGSFLTYSVTNDVGFASVEWTLDGEFLSDQPSGSLFLPDEGTYAFVVTAMDMNGCESVFDQNVDVVYVFPMVLVCSVLQYPCSGEPVGVIEATFLGGAPPYTYQWVNSQGEVFFGVNLQDIEPDDYTFTFIDSDGCQVQQTVVLSETSSYTPSVTLFQDSIACNGNLFISPTVSGGSGDFSYQWTPAFAVNDPTAQGVQIQQSFPLWVSVTVTDNETGCTASDSVFVSPNIQVNQTVSLCNGPAELTLDPGSMVYNWTATDPLGNTIDMSGVTGNSFTATELGTYEVMTYYSACNQVFHEFVVEECPSECPNEITVINDSENCGTSLCFYGGPGFFTYDWILNGAPVSVAQQFCTSQQTLPAGFYTIALVTTSSTGCVYTSSYDFNIVESPLTVNLLNDTIACNGNLGGIGPQVSGGSGDYSYLWEPTFAVSDPTVQSPLITASFPQWITVTVTDNETGCTASDSVFVSPNIQVNQTVSLCNGSAELTLDPGSMIYNWTATDPDGNTIDMSGVTGNTFTATELGTYTVMTYYSGCNQMVHEFELVAGLQIFLPDTVYKCPDGCVDLVPEVIGGVPGYFYVWSTGEYSESISICDFPGSYGCMAIDQSGCTVSAGVVVEEYPEPQVEISYSQPGLCQQLCFNVESEPAIDFESVSFGMGDGVHYDHLNPCHTYWPAPMTYTVQLDVQHVNGCTSSTLWDVEVSSCGDDVWPGDVNYDGVADNSDVLWLGLANGQNGLSRFDASIAWEGQLAYDWNFNFSQNNVNLKHADTDGNGTVNFADTVAISLNYGQTHGKTENALAGSIPALWVDAVPDTVAPGNGIVATVHLGSATQPVDSLHGIAFTLTFNDLMVDDADFTIDFSGNVLGTVGNDVMTLRKLFLPDGEVDVAVTRNTLQNFGGYGPLATFHIVTTDNLSGIHELRIGVSGVTAITAHGHAIELATVADTVIIDSDYVGIGEAFGSSLRVWPNPGSGIFRIEGLHGAEMVEVMDATGRSISRRATNGPDALTIDLSEQPDGLYLLRLSGRDGVAVRRLVKTR